MSFLTGIVDDPAAAADAAAQVAVTIALDRRSSSGGINCGRCKGTGTILCKCPDCGGSCMSQAAQDEAFLRGATLFNDKVPAIRRAK